MAEDLMTKAQAAQYLHISVATLERWMRAGLVPVVKLQGRRRILFRKEALDQVLRDHETRGQGPDDAALADRLSNMHQELEATRIYLSNVIDQYEWANEQLKQANDMIVGSNTTLEHTTKRLEEARDAMAERRRENEELRGENEDLKRQLVCSSPGEALTASATTERTSTDQP